MESLVLWEVSRKQDYIFKSNRLKENKGASIIIEDITEELPFKVNCNYKDNLVYKGGGSSLYKFDSREDAEDFVKNISKKVLECYPGIEVFMVIEEYDAENMKVIDAIGRAYVKLAQKKSRRKTSGMQVSFGIEKKCESTGLPASYVDFEDDEKRYISKEVKVKKHYSETGKSSKKFNKLIPSNKSIKKFADLVKGNKKYMAVIHIDGNKMGKKFNQLKEYFVYRDDNYKETNKEYLSSLESFSNEIKNVYEEAFRYMKQVVEKNADKLKDCTYINEGKIPIIPIIIAGDDITFVTNGKIGIECARVFIEYLNKKEIKIYKDNTVKLNACAGVAIVRANYPFIKAYKLAEDLCSNAKRIIAKDYKDSDKDFSLIDWHLEQGDLMGSIKEIREENYRTEDGKYLYMRPLYLNNEDRWNNYENFKEAYFNITKRKIGKEGKEEPIPRSKIKKLREILKKGENETRVYIESNNISQYFSRFKNTDGDNCFYKDQCMYFDSIEIIDLFIELDEKEGK